MSIRLLPALLLLAAACSAGTPGGLRDEALAATPGRPAIDTGELVDGGVGVDGIPPIDTPAYLDPAAAGRDLVDTEPVALVTVGAATHVYPLRVMTRHEIVNDVIGTTPVTVTFCPLCHSTVAFRRDLGGVRYDFGVSGMLYQSALVMYDRQTRSLWTHFDGRAVVGPLTGRRLDVVPSSIVAWADARRDAPGLRVVVADGEGLGEPRNPYQGYDSATRPFLFRGEPDPRLHAMERVVGVVFGGQAKAWPYAGLRRARVVADRVGGQPLVVLFDPDARSALDRGDITRSRQVGASGVFDPELGGQPLTFHPADDGQFTDTRTGSTWTITGRASAGPLTGRQLRPLPHLDAFWFAWAAYNPDTTLADPGR